MTTTVSQTSLHVSCALAVGFGVGLQPKVEPVHIKLQQLAEPLHRLQDIMTQHEDMRRTKTWLTYKMLELCAMEPHIAYELAAADSACMVHRMGTCEVFRIDLFAQLVTEFESFLESGDLAVLQLPNQAFAVLRYLLITRFITDHIRHNGSAVLKNIATLQPGDRDALRRLINQLTAGLHCQAVANALVGTPRITWHTICNAGFLPGHEPVKL